MLVPDGQWTYAPHLVFDARRVLAAVIPLAERVHARAYSIPAVAVELGAQVRYTRDASLGAIGMCVRVGDGLRIQLNDAIEGTDFDMAGLVHELGHAARDEGAFGCTGQLRRLAERDAWLRGTYMAISRPLAEQVADGTASVREVAGRCSVPRMIVQIRAGLAVLLGEAEGDRREADELVREQLLLLEQWFEDGKASGFAE